MTGRLEPTADQLAALAARPPNLPAVMVNLLTFKVDGGRQRYLQYAEEVVPHISASGPPSTMPDRRRRPSSVTARAQAGMRF